MNCFHINHNGEQWIYPENRDNIDVVSARDGEQCIYPEIRDNH